jgi:hypothetical protein
MKFLGFFLVAVLVTFADAEILLTVPTMEP